MTTASEALAEAARAELARIYGRTQRQVDADNAEAQAVTRRRELIASDIDGIGPNVVPLRRVAS